MPTGKKERKKLYFIFILFTWTEIQTIGSGNRRKFRLKCALLVAEGLILGFITVKMTLEKAKKYWLYGEFHNVFFRDKMKVKSLNPFCVFFFFQEHLKNTIRRKSSNSQ
jgi:hypothetical protein